MKGNDIYEITCVDEEKVKKVKDSFSTNDTLAVAPGW